jgi:ankyrin repeat protein
LALAIIRNKPETVRFLLDHGADANARSPEGKTLYQLAKDNGHEAVAEMLKTQLP